MSTTRYCIVETATGKVVESFTSNEVDTESVVRSVLHNLDREHST